MLFTVVLYFLAMEYIVSPGFTIYVVVVDGISVGRDNGIFIFWPIDRILLVKLFNSFISFTVVLYFFAIEYKLSPYFMRNTTFATAVTFLSIVDV